MAIKNTTKSEFSYAVEKKAAEEGITHLEALSAVMQECFIPPEDAAKLVNASLKAKIEAEALQKRMIRGLPKGGTNSLDRFS